MRVRVVRRGGVAGVALETTVDTAELTDPDVARVESALSKLPWGRPAPMPRHPDQFSYELTMAEDGAGGSAVLREDEVPPGLQPVLELLAERGTIHPGSG